jgi:hypothetical protein
MPPVVNQCGHERPLNRRKREMPAMRRFPAVRHCSAPPTWWSPSLPTEGRLNDVELRVEALLRDAARAVRQGAVEIDEVAAVDGPHDFPLFDVSLRIRHLEGDDPCLSLCRLLSQLLARLNLHLEGAVP